MSRVRAQSGPRSGPGSPPLDLTVGSKGITAASVKRFTCRARVLPLIALTLTVIVPSSSVPAQAGFDEWTSTGPYGGNIVAIAVDPIDPGVVYAQTDTGHVFKTTDGGTAWFRSDAGITRNRWFGEVAPAIVVNPKHPNVVFAAVTNTLFKSTDAGSTWSVALRMRMWNYFGILALAIDPVHPKNIYVSNGRVLRSSDGGRTWTPTGDLAPHTYCGGGPTITTLAVDPVDPAIVYAAGVHIDVRVCGGGGLYKSTDRGMHWSHLGFTGRAPVSLAIDPSAHRHLYASFSQLDQGVRRSPDGGKSWMPDGLSTLNVREIAIDPSSPGVLYAVANDVYVTIDGGAAWSTTGLTSTSSGVPDVLAVDPLTPGTVYVGTETTAVFKTVNGGMTWSSIPTGITDPIVLAFVVGPADPERRVVGTAWGLWRSTDGGTSWTSSSELASTRVEALAVDPSDPDHIYAGTSEGAYGSTDGGVSWAPAGLGGKYMYSVAIAPTSPITIYAGLGRGIRVKVGSGGWQKVTGLPTAPAWSVAVDPTDPMAAWAAVGGDGYQSIDGGTTWTKKTSGEATGLQGPLSIAIDPNQPSTMYLTGTGQLYSPELFRTIDGGTSWMRIHFRYWYGDAHLSNIVPDPTVPGTVYMTETSVSASPHGVVDSVLGLSGGEGVWISRDSAASWAPMNAGFEGNEANVQWFAVDPSMGTLYAGSWGGLFSFTPTDSSSPSTPTLSAPSAHFVTKDRRVDVAWSASDSGSGVAQYLFRELYSGTNQAAFHLYNIYWDPRTSLSFRGSQGVTYCFMVRAADRDANTSPWSDQACTAVPVDDRKLDIGKGHWSADEASRFYLGTLTSTSTRGATLTLPSVRATRIAVLVRRCPGCGTIEVAFGGKVVRRIHLASSTRDQVLVRVGTFSAVRVGRVSIRVVSAGKAVAIDGLAISKA
jgi:photosystem II stability/assembly factor-like uncharacterized protein